MKEKDLLAPCGIYCGLCNRYQSEAPSSCGGCRTTEVHDWCNIYGCCVKKKALTTCIECDEYPCERYSRRKWWGDEYLSRGSRDNLDEIDESGMEALLKELRARRKVVEKLIDEYNEGRSMSFYCRACSVVPVKSVKKAMRQAEKRMADEGLPDSDIKAKAKMMRGAIQEQADEEGVEIKK